MRPDLICAWPKHLDYPLFRKFIHDNRDRFSKVILVLTNMNIEEDYSQFLQEVMGSDRVSLIVNDPVTADKDWRNVAMNKALELSDAESIWFTEQDFQPLDGFWNCVNQLTKTHDVVAALVDGTRMHPCSIFIKRSVLDKTSKDFSANPPEYDHFGHIQKDIEALGEWASIPSIYWYHMNGLSQNMHLLQIGEDPNYNPSEFKRYCLKCLSEKIHPDFKELFEWYLEE